MDNVVYFLGAGFSAPLGLPVMSNFLIKSKDMYFEDTEQFKHFEQVFGMIKAMSVSKNYFETDLFNIEEILSILEMGQKIQGNGLGDSFQQYLVDVINHFTPRVSSKPNLPGNWHRYLFDKDVEHGYAYFVASLLSLSLQLEQRWESRGGKQESYFDVGCGVVAGGNARYSVITLNYDCVLENYTRWLFANCDGVQPRRFPLVKLHGCVEKKRIVPPTWNKALHSESIETWKQAFELLKEANHIRVIGYSLPTADSYVKYLLKAAIMESRHLKAIDVLCLDPSGSVRKRYDEFITFYKYRFCGFSVDQYLNEHFEMLLEPIENTAPGQPLKCNKLEDYHEHFFTRHATARG